MITLNTRHAKVKRMTTHQFVKHETVDLKICNAYNSLDYIFASINTVKFTKFHTIFTE